MAKDDDIPPTSSAEDALMLVLEMHKKAAASFGRPLDSACTEAWVIHNGDQFKSFWSPQHWEDAKHALKRVAEFHCLTAVGLSRLVEPDETSVSLAAYRTAGEFVRQFCPPKYVRPLEGHYRLLPGGPTRGDWCTWP